MKNRMLFGTFSGIVGAAALIIANPAAAMSESDVYKMMDANGDGSISRQEYVDYEAFQAAMRFDKKADGAASMKAAKVLETFEYLQKATGS